MKNFPLLLSLFAVLSLGLPLRAQEGFEFGGFAAGSIYKGTDVQSGSNSGDISYKPGPGGGIFFGQTMNGHFGGELRYLYARNSLKLTSGGAEATFAGQSHSVGYDLLFYVTDRDVKIRPYVAAGIGVKIYQGTGAERAVQPLSNLAILTNTNQTTVAGDFGAGVKVSLGGRLALRLEVRDYVSPVPDKVFAASPGAHINGTIFHQFVPAVGIGYTW